MELRPALTYDDLSRRYELSAEALHTEALGYRIPAVLGASSTFLMCHTDLFSFCFHEVFHHNGYLIGVLALEVPKSHEQIIGHALQVIRRVALVGCNIQPQAAFMLGDAPDLDGRNLVEHPRGRPCERRCRGADWILAESRPRGMPHHLEAAETPEAIMLQPDAYHVAAAISLTRTSEYCWR